MKTKTHIANIRELYAKNAATLIERLGYWEYYNLFLDIGLAFLREKFEKGDKYYKYHKCSAGFWLWFHAEFKLWENDLVKHLKFEKLNNNECKMELMVMAHHGETEQSFRENYLKHLKIF